ncbi:hypothetical protein CKO32_16270 [Afifella marina DSM 2698]|nr:hypothetical protein [Afifella marina DSM 2698]MBK1627018.1 hypothetical protein [Afifella marina]MBK5919355.1 hypothetical protein [Afifella marina]RAI19582.1 hypothetical protein CH311_12305 [Afifella marina DSM 2698]
MMAGGDDRSHRADEFVKRYRAGMRSLCRRIDALDERRKLIYVVADTCDQVVIGVFSCQLKQLEIERTKRRADDVVQQ